MKYTINEFATEIRKSYPGDYDDLSDTKLVELWLKKYPNDKEKIGSDIVNQPQEDSLYFSFLGLISVALFGFIAYKLFEVLNYIDVLEQEYSNNMFFQLFVNWFKTTSQYSSEYVDQHYSNFKNFTLIIFISYIVKTLISLRHTFFTKRKNSKYFIYSFILLEVICFGFAFGFDPFSDYLKCVLILGIPTGIGYLLLMEG